MDRRTFLASGLFAQPLLAAPAPTFPAGPKGIVLFNSKAVGFADGYGRIVHRFNLPEDRYPTAVSPNGRQLALLEIPRGPSGPQSIRIVSLATGVRVEKVLDAVPVDWVKWTHDGKWLIGIQMVDQGVYDPNKHVRNFLINPECGCFEELPIAAKTVPDKSYPVTRHTLFDITPDGKWLLTYVREPGNMECDLFLVSRDGKTVRPIAEGQMWIHGARLSPDGVTLLHSQIEAFGPSDLRRRVGYVFSLFTSTITGEGRRRIASVHTDIHMEFFQFTWSADGKRIAYCLQRREREGKLTIPDRLMTCDPNGGTRREVKLRGEWQTDFNLHGWV